MQAGSAGSKPKCLNGLCGSLLYSQVRDAEYAHVLLGVLTDTPSIRPTHPIHVGAKAPWLEITDHLPQYQEFD